MAGAGPLDGEVALVTGAGRGIGRAIAEGYAAAGAAVVLAARTAAEIEAVAEAIRGRGGRALAVPADVTRHGEVVALMERVREAHGGLDILVCNAGGNVARGRIDSVDPALWMAGLELNLVSAYHCAREALPLLRARGGGKILMLGSGMGWRSVPGNSSYCVAKAALSMLVKALAMELRDERISVNEIIPGPVETPATRAEVAAGHPSAFQTPGEWIKQPADVVPLALFLATLPDDGPTAQSWSLNRRER
jgi:3-oxoacyl-[acyl-carrier protein] reductase